MEGEAGETSKIDVESTTTVSFPQLLSNATIAETLTSATSAEGGMVLESLLRNHSFLCGNETDFRVFTQALLEYFKVENKTVQFMVGSSSYNPNLSLINNPNRKIPSEIFPIQNIYEEGTTPAPETIPCSLQKAAFSSLLLQALYDNKSSSLNYSMAVVEKIKDDESIETTTLKLLPENKTNSTEMSAIDSNHGTSKREAKNNVLVDHSATSPSDLPEAGANIGELNAPLPSSGIDTSTVTLPEDLLTDFNIFNQILSMLNTEGLKVN